MSRSLWNQILGIEISFNLIDLHIFLISTKNPSFWYMIRIWNFELHTHEVPQYTHCTWLSFLLQSFHKKSWYARFFMTHTICSKQQLTGSLQYIILYLCIPYICKVRNSYTHRMQALSLPGTFWQKFSLRYFSLYTL